MRLHLSTQVRRRFRVELSLGRISSRQQSTLPISLHIDIEGTSSGVVDHQISGSIIQRISGSIIQRISGSSDQRIIGSADQRIIGSADQRISGSSDQRISGSSDHRISGSADQRIIGSSDHRISGSSDQRISEIIGSADHRISGSSDQRISGSQRIAADRSGSADQENGWGMNGTSMENGWNIMGKATSCHENQWKSWEQIHVTKELLVKSSTGLALATDAGLCSFYTK